MQCDEHVVLQFHNYLNNKNLIFGIQQKGRDVKITKADDGDLHMKYNWIVSIQTVINKARDMANKDTKEIQ